MPVDQTSLDRIRNATFPSSRRGYDKQEVEKFLARLADWLETGAGDESRSDTVKRELERVGERTGAILAQAEESAQQIRAEAEEEARGHGQHGEHAGRGDPGRDRQLRGETRTSADAYAQQTRQAAEEEAAATRQQAEQDARETVATAQAQARRIVEEGTQRREDIEAVIADLVRRRNDVLADTEELTAKLTGAVSEHRPEPGSDPFEKPDEFDPLAREGEDEEIEGEHEAGPRTRLRPRRRRSSTPSPSRRLGPEQPGAVVSDVRAALDAALEGGPERHRKKVAEQEKLPVRERVARLLDADSLAEDGLLANWEQEGLGADGVVTGMGTVGGRPVALMANDPAVKAGSWGPKTVEKILRIQERALAHQVPIVYLVDSAGARITDQVRMFPGRRGAGHIFHTQVRLSGQVPQICLLFGPSAAGGAYIPAFCDVVIMRDGNASMYLGSPRMAEMVIGEKVTLEEMGGARMHTSVSGCGHFLSKSDEEAIDLARSYLAYMPANWREEPPASPPAEPEDMPAVSEIVPDNEKDPFDVKDLIRAVVDAESFLEVHARWAKEIVVGYARLDGRVIGDRGEPAEGEGRRALRRLRRQGRPVHHDLQRLQRARCSSWRTFPAS